MNILQKLYGIFEQGDLAAIDRLLTAHPQLLERDDLLGRAVRHGNLTVVKHMHKLGANNAQKAMGYIVYGNKRDIAEYLVSLGATMTGADEGHVLIGACEVLNPEAIDTVLALGDTPSQEDLWRSMAMALCTYTRNPTGKHQCIERLIKLGCELPDTLLMAFHKGDLKAIKKQLQAKPKLLKSTYTLEEIYPPKLVVDATDGLHLTPLQGATLLHLAVEYNETELMQLLFELGADTNAKAATDKDGFGGHTPIFHTVVSYAHDDTTRVTQLLNHGANPTVKASFKKQLKHMGNPDLEKLMTFTNATPVQYAAQFLVQAWVSHPSIEIINLHQAK